MSLILISRKQWKAEPVALADIQEPVQEVFIHHDVYRSIGAKATIAEESRYMRELEDFHQAKRGMKTIAYSFHVFPSGRVYEGRGWGKEGGHTYGHNSRSLGICFAGNFMTAKPTKLAVRAAQDLIARGMKNKHITQSAKILGHRDVGAEGGGTACPGNNLFAQLPLIRQHHQHKHDNGDKHSHPMGKHHHHEHSPHPHRSGRDGHHHFTR